MKIINTLLFISYASCSSVTAEPIYKSTDEKGNVTYSTMPPQDHEQSISIDITPPPSEKDKQAAQKRHQRNKETADILDENRKKRNEITAEENQLKRENQKQLQQKRQAEKNNDNNDYGYPYIPGRRPIGILPPVHGPVHLPAR